MLSCGRKFLQHIFLVALFVLLYDSNQKCLLFSFLNEFLYLFRENFVFESPYLNQDYDFQNFYSSVSCRGSNHTDRLCSFKNLCYEPTAEIFLFFYSVKSNVIGVPYDRFSPALTDFSSVSDHNTQYFNYIDVPVSAILKYNVSYIPGHALIYKRFNPENLMHVFHDDLIPGFVTLKEIFGFDDKIAFRNVFFAFADGRPPGPYSDLYESFLNRKPLYLKLLSNRYLHCFLNAHIGLNKHSTWYQYGFKEPQGPLLKHLNGISSSIVNFRNYFIKQFSLNMQIDMEYAVLLTRRQNRKILNEIRVVKAIEMNTTFETRILNLENYSVLEIIQEILRSQLIVGMHGSLLILSLFLPPYSIIIELFPYGVNPGISTPYKTLAAVEGLKLIYRSWENKIEKNSVPHPEYPSDYGGILHLSKEQQEKIKNMVVLPFLCCSDAIWLYRIYQDTVVDIKSFTHVLSDGYKYMKIVDSFEESSIENQLYPSEVLNITCLFLVENKTLNISWGKPWNVQFMNFKVIEYELWIQAVNSNNIHAFIMKKTSFIYTIQLSDNLFYIWVRCHIDRKVGPFNSNPLVCLE